MVLAILSVWGSGMILQRSHHLMRNSGRRMATSFVMASSKHSECQSSSKKAAPCPEEIVHLLFDFRRKLVLFVCYGYVRHVPNYFFACLWPRLFPCLDKLRNLPAVFRTDLRAVCPHETFSVCDHVKDVTFRNSLKVIAGQVGYTDILFSHRAIALALRAVTVVAIHHVKRFPLRNDRGGRIQRIRHAVGLCQAILGNPVRSPALRVSLYGIRGWYPHVHSMGVQLVGIVKLGVAVGVLYGSKPPPSILIGYLGKRVIGHRVIHVRCILKTGIVATSLAASQRDGQYCSDCQTSDHAHNPVIQNSFR